MGGEMMGMFKLVSEDKVSFYELLTIVPKDDSFVLRLKHFSPEFVGWEEIDEIEEFPLVSASDKAVLFYGLKFSKINDNEMAIEVAVGKDEKKQVVSFNCKRVRE